MDQLQNIQQLRMPQARQLQPIQRPPRQPSQVTPMQPSPMSSTQQNRIAPMQLIPSVRPRQFSPNAAAATRPASQHVTGPNLGRIAIDVSSQTADVINRSEANESKETQMQQMQASLTDTDEKRNTIDLVSEDEETEVGKGERKISHQITILERVEVGEDENEGSRSRQTTILDDGN